MADASEYEDFDQLLQSAGWQRFQAMVAKEWGDHEGNGSRFVAAVVKASNLVEDALAVGQLRQIVVTQREIQSLMRSPAERFETLKRMHVRPEPVMVKKPAKGRRGSL